MQSDKEFARDGFPPVTLEEVLDAREKRSLRQQEMLKKYGMPLVSFSMNIAGPVKRSFMGDFMFRQTVRDIEERMSLSAGGNGPADRIFTIEDTGCEALFAFDADAAELKKAASAIEDAEDWGRLLDIDVIGADGSPLSRGMQRPCMICGKPGAVCARSRAHSVEELQAKTAELLSDFCRERISLLAVNALKDEARLTPKPGLVDSNNSGAHKDMDLALMLRSAESLEPYFADAAELGIKCGAGSSEDIADAAPALQKRGIKAEKEMFEATGGVNTHKGAVYGLGLLCFGAGTFVSGGLDSVRTASEAASAIPPADPATHGNLVRSRFAEGPAGARDEAVSGFPNAVAALCELNIGMHPLYALVGIMADLTDTNVLWRGGAEGASFVKNTAKNLRRISQRDGQEAFIEALLAADADFTARNLSPGGSADILAQAMFLQSLMN